VSGPRPRWRRPRRGGLGSATRGFNLARVSRRSGGRGEATPSCRSRCPGATVHRGGTEGWLRHAGAIAAALNARGVRTARGGPWHAASVWRVLERDCRRLMPCRSDRTSGGCVSRRATRRGRSSISYRGLVAAGAVKKARSAAGASQHPLIAYAPCWTPVAPRCCASAGDATWAVDDIAGGEAGVLRRPRPSARAVVIKVFVTASSPIQAHFPSGAEPTVTAHAHCGVLRASQPKSFAFPWTGAAASKTVPEGADQSKARTSSNSPPQRRHGVRRVAAWR
jgi:hypothetical protein